MKTPRKCTGCPQAGLWVNRVAFTKDDPAGDLPRIAAGEPLGQPPECGDCDVLWGEPPPQSPLEQIATTIGVQEFFANPKAGFEPSPGLEQLRAYVAGQKTGASVKASKERTSKKQKDAGQDAPVTREILQASYDEFVQKFGNDRAWLKGAVLTFGLDAKTIRKRMKE